MVNYKTTEELKSEMREYVIELSPEILQDIRASPDKKIEIKLEGAFGPEFEFFKYNHAALYHFLKINFFTQGIFVDIEMDKEKMITLRERTPEDTLLPSFILGRFVIFAAGLEPFVSLLGKEIDNSSDKKISISIKAMRDKMAVKFPEVETKNDSEMFQGVRFILYQEGFYVEPEKSEKGEYFFIIRRVMPGDRLSDPLEELIFGYSKKTLT